MIFALRLGGGLERKCAKMLNLPRVCRELFEEGGRRDHKKRNNKNIYLCGWGDVKFCGFKTRRVELAREQVANVCCCCKTARQQVWTTTGELMFDAWKKFQNVKEHVREIFPTDAGECETWWMCVCPFLLLLLVGLWNRESEKNLIQFAGSVWECSFRILWLLSGEKTYRKCNSGGCFQWNGWF